MIIETKTIEEVHREMPHEMVYSAEAKALFGFWIYIMSDCLLFASIFASYAVLHNSTFGGPTAREIFSMPFVLTETLILLTSSFTYGLVSLYAHRRDEKKKVMMWLLVTFILGAVFIGMEFTEFSKLIGEGNGPGRNAFLSSFFTLVGTHGLHVSAGLLWIVILFIQIWNKGITSVTLRKISVLGLFWHFLDIVWIFIFTVVYLMGAI
jgi:cytochrome o ubiquinol oxidase subunit 3